MELTLRGFLEFEYAGLHREEWGAAVKPWLKEKSLKLRLYLSWEYGMVFYPYLNSVQVT